MSARRQFTHCTGDAGAEPYHYLECGLENVWLLNGFECEEFEGETYTRVLDMDALHRVIAKSLARETGAMDGSELRFLRKEMDLTQAELAQILGVTEQTVARWEKKEVETPHTTALIVRGLMISELGGGVDLRELAQAMVKDGEAGDSQISMTHDDTGWRSERTLEAA